MKAEGVDERSLHGCASGVTFSDRLFEQNLDKYNRIRREVFGDTSQYWGGDDPAKIERFLSLYFDRPVRLKAVTQLEKHGRDGFPISTFFYDDVQPSR